MREYCVLYIRFLHARYKRATKAYSIPIRRVYGCICTVLGHSHLLVIYTFSLLSLSLSLSLCSPDGYVRFLV